MPTMSNRLFRLQIAHLTLEQKRELGSKLTKAYQLTNIKKPIYRRKSQEPEGTFIVMDYPPEFNPYMDAVIENYVKDLPPPPKTRKRIPTKKAPAPVYSTKNYK